jgi:hypothetical protein
MSRLFALSCIVFATVGLGLAGCCGATGEGHDVSAPARPPGSHRTLGHPNPVEPGADVADDDSGDPGDDDSAPTEDPDECGEPPLPLPDGDAVRARLAGLMFCYQGPELDGLYWTVAEEQIHRFEVTAAEACSQTGHVDVDLQLRGEHDSITGQVRLFFGIESGAWTLQAIRRATVEDFEVKGEAPPEVLADRALVSMSCDILEREGLCWEYSRELIRDQGREPTRAICAAWRGTLVTEACPAADRRNLCAVEDSYVIHYYPRFVEENPFVTHRKHCELSGGEILTAVPVDP